MKRRSHSSLDAAVQGFQLFQRGNRAFIREDEGDGATFGRIGGLALCAGFWLGHGSRPIGGAKRDHLLLRRLDGGRIGRAERLAVIAGFPVAAVVSQIEVDAAQADVGFAAQGVHGLLRSVTVEPSYIVTSDASTTVRLVTP